MNAGFHPLRCACGALQGRVDLSGPVNRGSCYCKDCQAFAHFLGRAAEVLDPQGGTDVIGTAARRVSFTSGRERLACVRLTDKGMVRWYASCCRTPIGNTPAARGVSFVGLVHTCLRSAPASLEQSFGPVRTRANTKSAHAAPGLRDEGIFGAVASTLGLILRERLGGGYRRSPFFSADGAPVVTPRILSSQEWQELRRRVDCGPLA